MSDSIDEIGLPADEPCDRGSAFHPQESGRRAAGNSASFGESNAAATHADARVRDLGCRPATSAYIELPGLDVRARSDRSGRIELREVPPGTHRFLVWSANNGLIETTVNVSAHVREIILLIDLQGSLISRVSRPARGAGADLSSEKPDQPPPGDDA